MFCSKNNKTNKKSVSYQSRCDLTDLMVNEISHYKDLRNPQYQWDCALPCNLKVGADCYVVNNALRNPFFYRRLTDKDKRRVKRIVNIVTSAINLSPLPHRVDLIKGVSPFPELKEYCKDAIVQDKAFGSYSTTRAVADDYSEQNEDGEYIYFLLSLKEGDCALYIDEDESEYLLNPGNFFQVMDIQHEKINGRKAIFYYLALTT